MEKVKIAKYDFSKAPLIEDFPPYMRSAINSWFASLAYDAKLYDARFSYDILNSQFIAWIELKTREQVDCAVDTFFDKFFHDKDKTVAILDVLLEEYGNYVDKNDFENNAHYDETYGDVLEWILQTGGSAYSAAKNGDKWGLYYRVSGITIENSKEARTKDDSLELAWRCCYGVNPDYNKVVIESINCIEGILNNNYFPKDGKPQIGKFIKQLKDNGTDLAFLGADTLDEHGREALELLKNLSTYRGSHKSGTGKDATRDVALYALNTAIWFWNLHSQ